MQEELGELPFTTSRGKVKFGVIVGHTKEASGARMVSPYGTSEYDYNLEVAKHMLKVADKTYPNMELVIILRDGVGIAGAYKQAREMKCDCVIELHFNSFDSRIFGTETLCTSDANDIAFAKVIHSKVCEIFSRSGDSRGVKALSQSGRGGENVHSFPAGVNCLVEPFFGDHPADALMGASRQEEYAEGLVKAVYAWSCEVGLVR